MEGWRDGEAEDTKTGKMEEVRMEGRKERRAEGRTKANERETKLQRGDCDPLLQATANPPTHTHSVSELPHWGQRSVERLELNLNQNLQLTGRHWAMCEGFYLLSVQCHVLYIQRYYMCVLCTCTTETNDGSQFTPRLLATLALSRQSTVAVGNTHSRLDFLTRKVSAPPCHKLIKSQSIKTRTINK